MAEIRDTLPTYVNSKGETVTAMFNPMLNPGWRDNGDGIVSYVSEFIQDDLKQMEDIDVKIRQVVLRLAFPDAALKVNEKMKQIIIKQISIQHYLTRGGE